MENTLKNGQRFASCFANGGHNVAGNYPYFDSGNGKVVTFEMDINRCPHDNGEAEYGFDDKETMGTVTAYTRTLSDGVRGNVRVDDAEALAKYEQGKKLYFTRIGQYHFACASCHHNVESPSGRIESTQREFIMVNAGKILRTEILSPSVGQTTHWPVFRGGDNLNTLHIPYRRCMDQMRASPFPAGSEALNNLGYFQSYLRNGLPMLASVYRK